MRILYSYVLRTVRTEYGTLRTIRERVVYIKPLASFFRTLLSATIVATIRERGCSGGCLSVVRVCIGSSVRSISAFPHHNAFPLESDPFGYFRYPHKPVLKIWERFLCGNVLDLGAEVDTVLNTI